MSTRNLGIGDVSEEIHAPQVRNELSSKEGQIAAQQDLLVRQAEEIQELNTALNETIRKLSSETERALQLETDVKQRSEDLRNEHIALQNLQAAFTVAHGKIKDNDLEPDTNVVTYIERLFNTIDRLRGERDSLSRDVEFLESESRFTIEALEAKLSASISSTSDETVASMTSERDGLLAELQRKECQWEKDLEIARKAEQETREELEDVLHRMSEVGTHLQDVESERDSLRLQITNLMTDIQDAQEELNNAEGRYTTLQFHQLSNMTNNEATRNLRGQIEELENRVMRRTEQIGIHQHDIKRLETNLRLQEERLAEMTTELEMMAAQKDTMVEDCADAREARDEALIRVEQLEEELESSDGRNVDNAVIVESLIATIAQTVCQAREAIRLSREELAEAQTTHVQQSTTIQQLQGKETALRKSIQEYQNEIQELSTTLSQCQMEVKHVSAQATNVQQENCELVSQLENGSLQVQIHETTINDLRRLNQELRSSLQEQQLSKLDYNDAEQKLVQLKLEHTEAIGALQARLVKSSSDLEEVQTRYTSAQDAHQRTIQEANSSNLELEQQLGAATKKFAELEQLREQYNDMKEQLLSEKERNEDADETISQLRGELETLERNFQQTNVHLQSADDERLTLRQQMTELEAEVQRSKSLSHYLEIQIKDSNQLVSALKGDIERTKADLARSEKSWNTAEVNLSLQNAQHKREMTELERELSSFRSMPNLEQALAELEERNSEMEELLRNKCVEIEENDDRALEMLKEKKKLMTKVESLTRKVQNLQAKLAAAKASSAAQPPPESQPTLPAPSFPLTSPTPQFTNVPISSRSRSATVPSAPPLYPPPIDTPSTSATQNPSNRIVSGPSFLPRPKTPERRTVTPVFKARTPERQIQPEIAPIPPVPVIGRKRAVPDDFEAYGTLPAQAFTADGEDIENMTPRERKAPNSLQFGFTPVRNQSSRPIASSPRRGAPSRSSPFISDLTNSPHHLAQMNPSSAKPSMRSWLGKIRGNSHATDRPQVPGMRPRSLFDRGDRS